MANRSRVQNGGGRRMDYGRNDRGKSFGRPGVSPWQGGGPGAGIQNILPLASGSTEATLALANNLISNLLQTRQQNTVPSLLDMPIRRDFGPDMNRFDRGGYGMNRMGNQGNFRRSGNYQRTGDRINTNRKSFRPSDGPRNHNKSTPNKKDADSKAKPVKESDVEIKKEDDGTATAEEGGEGNTKKASPKTRYDDISPSLLKCHICNKSMWDGRSFENHLSGRAHGIMMQKTAESYALTADTMRQEFKIREMKRTRKSGVQIARDFYCAMCDMFAADGAAHRTTLGHRKLKKYLHPTCTSCRKEMPTRIELDEHRLTPEHLRGLHDRQELNAKPKPEVMVISTLSMEQSYVRDDRYRRRQHDQESQKKEGGEENAKADGENANEEGQDDQQNQVEVKAEAEEVEVKEEKVEPENLILDFKEDEDFEITTELIPEYSTSRGVGASFLSAFECVQCRLCRKLLDSRETADVHLRTWRHHQLYVRALRDRQRMQNGGDAAKRSLNATDDGVPETKRTKTEDDAEDDAEDNGQQGDEDNQQDEEQNNEAMDTDQFDGGDWEQAVDEILQEENAEEATTEPVEEQPNEEQAPVEEEVVQVEPEVEQVGTRSQGTPRARGSPRARGRGRRRY